MDGDAALARQRTGRVSGTKPAPLPGRVPVGVGVTGGPSVTAPRVPGWVAGRRRAILVPCSACPERSLLPQAGRPAGACDHPHPGDELLVSYKFSVAELGR